MNTDTKLMKYSLLEAFFASILGCLMAALVVYIAVSHDSKTTKIDKTNEKYSIRLNDTSLIYESIEKPVISGVCVYFTDAETIKKVIICNRPFTLTYW